MARITQKTTLDLCITFSVNEEEARALEALAGYGDDAFIKAFYEKLGSHYMSRHEQGLREFLCSIRAIIPKELYKINRAREALSDKPRVVKTDTRKLDLGESDE